MSKRFTGKNILITGGASGIGKLVAQRFAELGNTVIVWDLNAQNLQLIEEWAKRRDLSITGMICDIANRQAVYKVAEEVQQTFGPIDVLINNAGVVSGKSLLDTPDEKILLTMNVNVLALFWVTKAFLPGMIKKGCGHLVTIASAAGLIGVKGLVDYSTSKFAAVGFTESIRVELSGRQSGIRTTTVCPFFINTGMFNGVKTRFPFLLPIMKPEYVAGKIVKAIIFRKKLVVLPLFARTIFLLRLFPVSVLDKVASFFGINHSMDDFTGRKDGV